MFIEYSESKEVICYRDFVLNPDNRIAARAFSKTFGVNLMEPAKKLHDRLTQYVSAGEYNAIYGTTENRIEIKKGDGDKASLVFKVRIGRSHRKFFNHLREENRDILQKKEWQGNFHAIKTIYVIAVNNHDYNAV